MTTRRKTKQFKVKGGADAAQKGQAAVLRRYFKHYPYKKVMMNPSPFFDANGKPLTYGDVLNNIIHSGEMIGMRYNVHNTAKDMSHKYDRNVDVYLKNVKNEFKQMLYDLAYDRKIDPVPINVFNNEDVRASLNVPNIKGAIDAGRNDSKNRLPKRINPIFGGRNKTVKKGGADLLQRGKAAEVRVYFEDNQNINNFVDRPGNINDKKSYYTALSEIVHSDDDNNVNSKDHYGDQINHFWDLKNNHSADAEKMIHEASEKLYNKIIDIQKNNNPAKFFRVFENESNVHGLPIYNLAHKQEVLLRYKLDKLLIDNDKTIFFTDDEIRFLHLNRNLDIAFPKLNDSEKLIINLIYLVHTNRVTNDVFNHLTKKDADTTLNKLPNFYKKQLLDLLKEYWENKINTMEVSELKSIPFEVEKLIQVAINKKKENKKLTVLDEKKKSASAAGNKK